MIALGVALFVQMIHFTIAWYLIDTFLFKPLATIAFEQEHSEEVLLNAVAERKALFIAEQSNQVLQWHKRKELFNQHIPQIQVAFSHSFANLMCPIVQSLPNNEKEAVIQELSAYIVKKVVHHE